MIIKEWNCLAHGAFDAPSLDDGENPGCPHGCGNSMVERAFRTAPAFQTQGYRNMNATFDTLAREQGVTNMSNKHAMQDGIGMRKSTPETHRRLNEATQLIMHHSKAGLEGMDAAAYFKPLSDFGALGVTAHGAMRKESKITVTDSKGETHTYGAGRTLLDNGMKLGLPAPTLVAAPFNGTTLGTPEGDS